MKSMINRYNLIFTVQCVLFFLLSLFFFPQIDDLIYKYELTYNNMFGFFHNVLYYGNGRFLGNMISMFFCNHIQWLYIAEDMLVVVFAVIVEKLTELKNSKIFVLAAVTAVPLWQFKQFFPFMSSFVNYFIPTLLFLLTLLIVKNKCCNKNKLFYLILFVLGFCEQLFVEHNAIINITFSLCLIIYCIVKHLKHIKEFTVLFISNIIGAGIIFGYKTFIDVTKTYNYNTLPDYRSNILDAVEKGGIVSAIDFSVQHIKLFVLAVFSSVILMGTLICIMIFIEKKASDKRIKHKSVFAVTMVVYSALYIIILCNFGIYNNDIPRDHILFLLLLVLLVLSFILLAVLFIKIIFMRMNNEQKIKLSFLAGLSLLSFAPFLLVGPFSFRAMFLSLFFLMLSVLEIMKFAFEKYGFRIEKVYDTVCILNLAALIIYTGFYARGKKIFDYKEKYCCSSYYLPAAEDEETFNVPDSNWTKWSGMEHEFIPLNEFEKLINDNA